VTGNQPSLAIIVRNLKICCEKVVNCVEANKQANVRLNNIDELSTDELKQVRNSLKHFLQILQNLQFTRAKFLL
jgi:molybdopterin-guanine dinucleotide biosynthesis protein A